MAIKRDIERHKMWCCDCRVKYFVRVHPRIGDSFRKRFGILLSIVQSIPEGRIVLLGTYVQVTSWKKKWHQKTLVAPKTQTAIDIQCLSLES